MMRLDPYRSAASALPRAVFVVGLGLEGVIGYSDFLDAGELVSSDLEDPELSALMHPATGGSLTLWLHGLTATPPDNLFSALRIYAGDDFDEQNIVVELEVGSSADMGDNVRRWTWPSATAGNPFADASGQTFGIELVP